MVVAKLNNSRKEKRLFSEFAKRHDLVYFGNVEVDESDDPILGISFASSRDDDHYMHGNINDYEVSLIKRKTKLKAPKHNSGEYLWTILRVRLKVSELPHMYIDAHQYDELLYKNVFSKFARLRMMNNVLVATNPSFSEFFQVFAPAETNAYITEYLTDTVMQRMLQTFTALDVEISDNNLYIYRNDVPLDTQQFEDMLNEALWLAEHLEWVQNNRVEAEV